MLNFYVKESLIKRGYKPTAMVLRKMGLGQMMANQLVGGKAKGIRLDVLEQLCIRFECTPNDLLNFVPDDKDQVTVIHPLNKLTKGPLTDGPANYIRQLSADEIEEANKILAAMVEKRNRGIPGLYKEEGKEQ